MKILYVVSGTGLQGGATKSFFAMADGVAAAGHEIRIVAPDGNGVTVAARERGWEVLVVPYRFATLPALSTGKDKVLFLPRLLKSLIINRKARKVVERYVEEYRPDIIHDNTSVTDIGHYAAEHIGAIHVTHVREYGWKDFRLLNPGLKKRLKYSKAALIAITEDLKKLRGKFLPEAKKATIYNGVVSAEMIRYKSDKSPYFLYAGRVQHAKGVSDLIAAYIKYCDEVVAEGKTPLRLIMAGSLKHEPKLCSHLQTQLQKAGYDKNVEWLGEITGVDKYMEQAAATVIPSYREGFGRVMPEAMAAGSLCIGRNTGGTAEQLENGRKITGRDIALSFGNDSDSGVGRLAGLLQQVDTACRTGELMTEGGEYHRMIKDAQTTISRLYLREEVGKKVIDFYSTLLK